MFLPKKRTTIGSAILCSTLALSISLPALGQDGTWIWAQQSHDLGQGYADLSSVAMDPAGNTVAGGYFSGVIGLGDTSLATGEVVDGDALVVKFDPTGGLLWARTGGCTAVDSWDGVSQVAIDGSGNVFVIGNHAGDAPVLFDGVQIADGGPGSFLCKYDPEGSLIYAQEVSSGDSALSLAVDAQGNVDVVGGNPFFWKRYDPAGSEILAWQLDGQVSASLPTHVVRGPDGAMFIQTNTLSALDADPGGGVEVMEAERAVLLKYDGTGAFVWSLASSGGWMSLHDLVVNSAGELFVCGFASDWSGVFAGYAVSGGGFIMKLAWDGIGIWHTWIFETDGGAQDVAALSLDDAGDLYAAGPVTVQNITSEPQYINGVPVPVELSDYLVGLDEQTGAVEWIDFVRGSTIWRPYVQDIGSRSPGRIAVSGGFNDQVIMGSTELTCVDVREFYAGVHDHSTLGLAEGLVPTEEAWLIVAGGHLRFRSGISDITVRDVQGRVVWWSAGGRTSADLRDLSDGIYSLVGNDNGKTRFARFAVTH